MIRVFFLKGFTVVFHKNKYFCEKTTLNPLRKKNPYHGKKPLIMVTGLTHKTNLAPHQFYHNKQDVLLHHNTCILILLHHVKYY